jgi:hypothetical protein
MDIFPNAPCQTWDLPRSSAFRIEPGTREVSHVAAIDEWVSWKAAIMSHEFFVEPENPCSKASELRLA